MPLFDRDVLALWNLLDAISRDGAEVRVLAARSSTSPGKLREAHQHWMPTLVACLTGTARIAHSGGVFDLAAGDALVVAPGAWHEHRPVRPGCALWQMGMRPDGADVYLTVADRNWVAAAPLPETRPLLEALVSDRNAGRRRRLIAELAGHILAGTGSLSPLTPAQARMSEYLWRRLDRPISASDVLAASGLSPRQAHRQFIAYFGNTPAHILLHHRLQIAAQGLREGAAVADVARIAGFTDRRSFTRAWRRLHGATPTAWCADDPVAASSRRRHHGASSTTVPLR